VSIKHNLRSLQSSKFVYKIVSECVTDDRLNTGANCKVNTTSFKSVKIIPFELNCVEIFSANIIRFCNIKYKRKVLANKKSCYNYCHDLPPFV